MLIKFTKAGFATALCLLMAYVVNAQITNPSTYDLRFANEQIDCANDKFCATLEIKASTNAGDFALGSHTIVFTYANAAINTPTYLPISFDTSVVCAGSGGFEYHPFQNTAFSFEETGTTALANLTTNLQFYVPSTECPVVSQEWQTMGEVCFDIVDETQNAQLQFDSGLTAINISTNAPSPQHTQGELLGNETSLAVSAGAIGLDKAAACITESIAVSVQDYLLGNPNNGYLGLVISANPDILSASDFAANAPYLAMAQGSSIAIENANNSLPLDTPLYVYSYVGEGEEGNINPTCFALTRSEAFQFSECLIVGDTSNNSCNIAVLLNTTIGECSTFPASACVAVSGAALPYVMTLTSAADGSIIQTVTISTPNDVEYCFENLSDYFYELLITDDNACSFTKSVAFPVVDPFPGIIINNQSLITDASTQVCTTITNENACISSSSDSYAITTLPTSGTATIDSLGNLCYTPNEGFVGTDALVIESCGVMCDTATISIEVLPWVTINNETSNNPDCNSLIVTTTAHDSECDSDTGVACLNIQGGTTPYTISGNWNLNADSLYVGEHCFHPLAPNTYNFTVYDLSGCQTQATVVINDCNGGNNGGNGGGGETSNGDCSTFTATSTSTDTHCDSTNARVCITLNGGTTPYTISGNWNLNADNLLTGEYCFENLAANTYSFTIYDLNGCQKQIEETVACYLEDPPIDTDCTNFNVTTNATMTSCDYNDGIVCLYMYNGTAPYSVQGINGTTQNASSIIANEYCFSGLQGGSYEFAVTDTNGCSFTVVDVVTLPLDCGMLEYVELSNDDASVTSNGTVCIDVLENDNYASGGLTAVLTPSFGTTNIDNNQICYTPNTDYTGNDSFSYVFCSNNLCDTATVSIVVNAQNGGGNGGGETSNNTDCNSLVVTSEVQNTACDNATGQVCLTINGGTTPYTITGNWNLNADNLLTGEYCFDNVGANTYNFTIYDLNGCQRQISATVACGGNNGGSTETAPVANNDSASGQGTITISPLANDTATDNDTFNITEFTQPAHGTVAQNGNSFTYTPTNAYVGTDAFTYTVCDNDGCSTATVNITVQAATGGNNGGVCQNPDEICLGMFPNQLDLCFHFCDVENAIIDDWETIYNCSVVVMNDTCIRYTPLPGFYGNETLEITACNAEGECMTVITHLYIGDQADCPWTNETQTPPVANPDYAGVDQNSTGHSLYVTTNDQQTDGDAFSIDSFTQPTHGTVTQNADVLIYVPNSNYVGTDEFTYTICDNDGCSTTTVYIWVNETNNGGGGTEVPPVANTDYAGVDQNSSGHNLYVTTNDQETNGDPFTIDSFTQPTHGTVTQNGNVLVYVPNTDYVGTDEFTYTLCDNDGCSTATVYLWINEPAPIQQYPPIANNDYMTIDQNETIVIDVTANDQQTDGDTFSINSFTQPANGTVTAYNGQLVYTPTNNYSGNDQFSYTICDNDGCSTATVYITIESGCSNPNNICIGQFPENTDFCINFCNVPDAVINDWNTTYNCSVILLGNNCVQYTPLPGYYGTDHVTLIGCNAAGQCDTVVIDVVVSTTGCASNETPPIANADYVEVQANQPLTISATANDVETDGDDFTIDSFTQPANGTVTLVNGQFVYIADNDFTGEDTFTYTICDNDGCSTATVHVYVQGGGNTQSPPIANNDYVSAQGSTPLTINVTANDQQTDGDTFSIDSFTQPANGTVTLVNGQLIYTANEGFEGEDTFTYTICDNDGCSTATVHVYVQGAVVPPACDNADYICLNPFPATQTVCVNFCNVADAVVVDSDTYFHCSIQILSDSCVQYTPLPGFTNATDTLQIYGCNGNGQCDTVTILIHVGVANCGQIDELPPVAIDDHYTTPENTPITINALSNDSDPDGDTFTVSTYTQPQNGTVTFINGQFTYTPNNNFVGTDQFDYQICDETALCDIATVYITVENQCDDTQLICAEPLQAITICTHFCDLEGTNGIHIEETSTTFNCSIVLLNDTCIQYTALPGYNGHDTLIVVACNAAGLCDTNYVYLFVGCAAPSAVDDNFTTNQNGGILDVLDNDFIACADEVQVSITDQPQHGTVTITANGEVLFIPDADYIGTDEFSYQVCNTCDLTQACDIATVTVTITEGGEPNNEVNAQPDVVQTPFNTPITISVLDNDFGDNLTVTEVTQPIHGTVVINADGTITYTPTTGTYGPDYFFYTVCDNQGNCDQTLVSITVLEENATNNPPNAGNDIAITATNQPITINVLANDSDPEGGTLTIMTVLTDGTHGTVTINPDGTITYTPPTDFVGVDTFAYIVCDDALPMACDTAYVGVAVGLEEYPNQYPVAAQDAAVTDPGNDITIDVLANDYDPDGDDLTVNIVSFPVNGTAVLNPDGTITYQPYPDFQGTDYIAYTICDNGTPSLCDTAYITIQVGTGNLPPIAVNDSTQTSLETPIEIFVMDNDSDPNGDDLLVVAIIDQPIHGEAIIAVDGTYIGYIPFMATDVPTIDSFTYVVCETFFGGYCDTATVYVSLYAEINLQPDIVYTNENQAIEIDVLDNDFGCELSLTGASNPENGAVEFNTNGTVVYTPNEGFTGTDYFYYQACDCSNNCDETLVAVNVLADTIGNLAPIAVSDVAATDGNTPITINVLANDVDPNGDPLTVTATIDPEHGTLVINADGTITYTPDEGFAGCDIFGYVVCDNAQPALCDTAYVVVEVATDDCANQAPIADNEIITVIIDTPIDIAVLEGDSDPDGDDLIIVNFTEPLHGTVVLDTLTGVFTYTPDPNYEGNDQFTYIVCDNGNPVLCDTAYVSISIQTDTTQNIVDAQPDVAYTSLDQPIVIDVLANDFGDDISITNIVTQPTNGGSVGITTDGISYIPATGFTGTDYFEYEICDNAGNCDVTLVTIYVLPEDSTNVAPNAANDVAETDMDTPVCVDVLANDTDGFGGDNLTITNYTQPDAGTVVLDTITNQLCYTPPAGFMGIVEFSYTVCDNGNPELCDTAVVVITVGLGEPSNNPPIAGDDEYTIPMNSTFEIDIVTPNDTDPDGDNLTISFVSDPQGTVTILDDHSISYITPEGFVGTDFFYYVVCDDGNPILCDTAYVTIDVLPELQEVIANPDIDYTTVDVPVIIHPMDNDSGSGISIVYVGTPINGGSVIINNGNSVTYTPALGFVGTDAFIYTICDGLNNCDTSLVTVVVLDLNTTNIPPVAVNDVAMTNTDTPLCINVLYNDFDAYGGDVIFINMYDQTTVNGGTITQQSDSILCYTPPTGYVGVDQFTYIICDNGNPIMCDTAYVVIGVGTGELPNNAPVAEDDVAQTYTNIPITINVLGNDSDPDGDNIIITLLTDPLGTVEIVNGSVLYTPPTGFEGTDYFAYIVCDDGFPQMCDTAYVTIDVLPFIPDTTIVTPEDTPDTLCIATIAGTDMPVTSITVIQAPVNGTIDFTTDTDSCLIYIPNPNYCGEDAFIIQVCDAMNMCDTLLIGVEIACVEELPIALNDTISTSIEQPIDIWVLQNDYDPDGDPIVVVTILTPPTNGTATIINDSTIVYTPNEDFFGQDSLQYVINDDDGADTAWVFISVDLDPNNILAINDSVTTQQDTPITIAVLSNDIYPEGITVITIVTQPTNGTAAITADGDSITYIPTVGFVGIDSFQYELCVTNATTGETICDTATVFITITQNEEPLECDVVFANAFSPNGDGTNELWLIENADNLSECYNNQEIQPELMIFNRWGDKVYHAKGYTNTNAWNGKFNNNGDDLPDGTYFYIFRVSENDEKNELKQGYIELRR